MRNKKENKLKVSAVGYPLLFLFLFIFIFSFTSVSAFGYNSDSKILNIGTFNQGQPVNLIQSCDNCTYVNITKLRLPNGTLLNLNKEMEQDGVFYNYSLNTSLTTQIGEYQVSGVGDENGLNNTWFYDFNVNGGNSIFFIIGFILAFGITGFGLKMKHEWITLAGTFLMLILGIYTSFNGIGIFKNNLTTAISYITILLGLGLGFETLRELTYY